MAIAEANQIQHDIKTLKNFNSPQGTIEQNFENVQR